jgi:hypothetical protein
MIAANERDKLAVYLLQSQSLKSDAINSFDSKRNLDTALFLIITIWAITVQRWDIGVKA